MQALFGVCLIFVIANITAMQAAENFYQETLGGTTLAGPGEFKFVVAVRTETVKGTQLCTGTVLGQMAVLTAGHCIEGWKTISVLVNCTQLDGCTNIRNGSGILHPQYEDGWEVMSDIGYIKTDKPIGAEEVVSLAPAADFYRSCTIVGYGPSSISTGKTNRSLRKLRMKEIVRCRSIFSGQEKYSNSLCAYLETELTHSYFGGPLLCDGEQVGITSQCVNIFIGKERDRQTVLVWSIASKGTNWMKVSMSANLKLRLVFLVLLAISSVGIK